MPTTASPEQWAREQRRRYLLAQMGIRPLVSRFDPVGARPAQRVGEPLPVKAASPLQGVKTAADSPSSPARPKGPAPKIAVSATAARGRPASDAPPIPATPVTADAPPVAEGVQFSLLIAAAAGYLWIEQLPEQVLAREQVSLTTAMACALAGPEPQLVYRQFDWPIVANPALPTDLNTARQSLGAMLGRMRDEQAKAGVILMGDCELLPELPGAVVHRIPTTLAMLETPALKAEAWAVLKPLAGRG